MNNNLKGIEKTMNFLMISIVALTIAFSMYTENYGRDFISFLMVFGLGANLYMIGKLMIKRWKILENNDKTGE